MFMISLEDNDGGLNVIVFILRIIIVIIILIVTAP